MARFSRARSTHQHDRHKGAAHEGTRPTCRKAAHRTETASADVFAVIVLGEHKVVEVGFVDRRPAPVQRLVVGTTLVETRSAQIEYVAVVQSDTSSRPAPARASEKPTETC